ncbi:MAG: hypothetical protein ACPGSC_09655 [Granulosicoccaceae bacterium]
MLCFKHAQEQAVGICRSCNKAVCRQCAIELPKGLACSSECQKDVHELVEMNERGKKLYGIGDYKTNKLATGVWVWLLMTGTMWVAAGLGYLGSGSLDIGHTVMAVLFSVISFIVYRSSKRTGLNC